MTEYIAYQSMGIFVFKVSGRLTDKRRSFFERHLEDNGIRNYYLHSSAEDHSAVSLTEVTKTYSDYQFKKVVDWAKLMQLADNDEEGLADIEDIVTRAVQREASALERLDVPKKMFAGKRMN